MIGRRVSGSWLFTDPKNRGSDVFSPRVMNGFKRILRRAGSPDLRSGGGDGFSRDTSTLIGTLG